MNSISITGNDIIKFTINKFSSLFSQFAWIAAITVISSASIASSELFIYQAPNGEQVVTDRKLNIKDYSLVFYSGSSTETANVLKAPPVVITGRQSRFEREISNAAKLYGVDIALIKAVIKIESNFNPQAVSHKGAQGLMQLMPATAGQYNVRNSFDPRQNIYAGTKHLRYLMAKFNNDMKLALAAYNAGETPVIKYGGIPPYPETQAYVSKVMKQWRRY